MINTDSEAYYYTKGTLNVLQETERFENGAKRFVNETKCFANETKQFGNGTKRYGKYNHLIETIAFT